MKSSSVILENFFCCMRLASCSSANASASLFTGAKISHLGLLPQGQPERFRRVVEMVEQMDLEGFGHCTLYGECMEACPKLISIDVIARMNRDYLRASLSQSQAASVEYAG